MKTSSLAAKALRQLMKSTTRGNQPIETAVRGFNFVGFSFWQMSGDDN